jgi:nitric oxide reductase activation protein
VKKNNVRLVLMLVALIVIVKVYERSRQDNQPEAEPPAREDRAAKELDGQLTPTVTAPEREGLAAAIALDVSGSMDEKVAGLDGRKEKKIDIARRAAVDLVEQFATYARDHQDEPVLLGLYEFSRRRGQPDCRPVIQMGAPDRTRAASAIASLQADGGTPIGQAMIAAKLALDATGLSRRHLLVLTDGENTDGIAPERVAVAINKRPSMERPSIYFVAFDVEAARFKGILDTGGLVLSAANAAELNGTFDSLLRGKILVEK